MQTVQKKTQPRVFIVFYNVLLLHQPYEKVCISYGKVCMLYEKERTTVRKSTLIVQEYTQIVNLLYNEYCNIKPEAYKGAIRRLSDRLQNARATGYRKQGETKGRGLGQRRGSGATT